MPYIAYRKEEKLWELYDEEFDVSYWLKGKNIKFIKKTNYKK
jgi:hypothetical protein